MAAKKGPVTKAVAAVKGAAKGAVETVDKKVVKPAAKAVGLGSGKKATKK